MRVPHEADRAKVITACATLARTSWHVDDEEMAEAMRQHCCDARDAVGRMHDRIRELEAENARLREAGLAAVNAYYGLPVSVDGLHDAMERLEKLTAKRGTP